MCSVVVETQRFRALDAAVVQVKVIETSGRHSGIGVNGSGYQPITSNRLLTKGLIVASLGLIAFWAR